MRADRDFCERRDSHSVTKVNATALSRGVTIVRTAAANSTKGGKDEDTIYGGAGKDTISLGDRNVILVIGNGNITVNGAKDKAVTVIDARDKETSQVYSSYLNYNADRTAATLTSSFSGTLKAEDYSSTVKKIDTATSKKPVNIVGNAQDNYLAGGTGSGTLTVKNAKSKKITVIDANTQTRAAIFGGLFFD